MVQEPHVLLALCEAMAKKGRCSDSGNGPLTFPRQLDVAADAAIVDRALDAKSSFRKCGENRKPPSTTRFFVTKPQVAEV